MILPMNKRLGATPTRQNRRNSHDHRGQGSPGDRGQPRIGQALVAEALARGAKRVYAAPASPWPTPVLPAASPRGGQRSTARDS